MPKPKSDLATAVHSASRAPAPPAPDVTLTPARRPSRRDTKGVVIHVTPEMNKALRQIALDEDTSLQALGVEVFERLIAERYRQ